MAPVWPLIFLKTFYSRIDLKTVPFNVSLNFLVTQTLGVKSSENINKIICKKLVCLIDVLKANTCFFHSTKFCFKSLRFSSTFVTHHEALSFGSAASNLLFWRGKGKSVWSLEARLESQKDTSHNFWINVSNVHLHFTAPSSSLQRERDALVSKDIMCFSIRHGAAFLQYSQTWHSGAVKVLIMTYYS